MYCKKGKSFGKFASVGNQYTEWDLGKAPECEHGTRPVVNSVLEGGGGYGETAAPAPAEPVDVAAGGCRR